MARAEDMMRFPSGSRIVIERRTVGAMSTFEMPERVIGEAAGITGRGAHSARLNRKPK
jgi:hypothetical protein